MQRIKKYIATFRLKELKEVLGKLGMPRAGRKPELMQRLLCVFNEVPASGNNKYDRVINIPEAVRLVEEAYRQLQGAAGPS
eukprot:CAMPEP_0114316658 /NCGR_PEP_ID=MMETSP0059-20121206/23371_1 /TAXON_ID=36894 /ORGANISM="Pyramimonas parkeae, Strain CCMP726" /LENGTH=80 /DNA_ID=CAMNT_0001442705 /DNA_START=45 /DNA_END=284 /DNA_ORIENTATION=+